MSASEYHFEVHPEDPGTAYAEFSTDFAAEEAVEKAGEIVEERYGMRAGVYDRSGREVQFPAEDPALLLALKDAVEQLSGQNLESEASVLEGE
ncbi:MAG: hypothetical protein ABEI58_00790 [Candidatus Nanohaloarchaea archaeon]